MGTTRMREGPSPLVARKHTTHSRIKAHMTAFERFVAMFPDLDPALQPIKPGIHPGLYTLVVQSGDIIPLDLMTDLLALVKNIRNMYEADKLARKIFGAWGVLQWMPELTVNLFIFVNTYFYFRFLFVSTYLTCVNKC